MIHQLIIIKSILENTFINYLLLQEKIKSFHIYYDFYSFILIRNYKKICGYYSKKNLKILYYRRMNYLFKIFVALNTTDSIGTF